ncbi:MAG: hypothetical protein ACTSO7_04825 [Candidatus Heimdallarchaeota archaeon]
MIQFVWIIIKDTPVAGMRFIKLTDEEEQVRLQKFYGWLSGPISEFTGKVQDLIIENTKYYYHSTNNIFFVVGVDIEETSIPSVFLPELENRFFEHFPEEIGESFDGSSIAEFRVFDQPLMVLVKAFEQRKKDTRGSRKNLDAFEVLNLPSELQMVALVLVKLQVVTPNMVSQVTGITSENVDRQLREIYQRGYLYITTISEKSYYSILPFGSDESPRIITRSSQLTDADSLSADISITPVDADKVDVSEQELPAFKTDDKPSKFDLETAEVKDSTRTKTESMETAMMAPPGWNQPTQQDTITSTISDGTKITPQFEDASELEPMAKTTKTDAKGIKLKIDPIGQEIDRLNKLTIIIPKNGFLPSTLTRREKGFASGKIRLPNEKNRDPFLLSALFKKDLENLFEAMIMGGFIVLTGNDVSQLDQTVIGQIFDTLNLLTPHRELQCLVSTTFIHPKDADVIVVPDSLLKYYSWATIVNLDQNKIVDGKSSEFSRNLVKKLRKITDPKEYVKEITNATSVLLKVCRDINTLKMDGRPPDLYLNEVKKTFGIAALDAALILSERLIRLQKDCAYIAGFYIRKGLDIAVRAIIIGDPIVVIGDDPIDVLHIIGALSIFSPHKAINAQIWTTNFAGINLDEFDLMGAQEGTDKLFRDAVKINLQSMSAFGGQRSEFLHNFLRKMWRRRSRERPKFIRDRINEMFTNAAKLVENINSLVGKNPTKDQVKDITSHYDSQFIAFISDLIKNDQPEIVDILKMGL